MHRLGGFVLAAGILVLSPPVTSPTRAASSVAPADCAAGPAPTSVEEWVRRGDCLLDAGRPDAALKAYEQGLRARAGGTVDLHVGMARAYEELNRHDAMFTALETALRLDPSNAEALYWLGIGYEVTENYPAALESFRKALAVRPNDNRALRNVGFVLLQQGQPEAALEPLEAAIRVAPDDWKAHLNLASAYAKTYQALFAELQNSPRYSTPHRRELEEKIRTVPYRARALEHSREAARLNPDDFITQYGLGTALIEDGNDLPGAIAALERAVAISPREYRALRNLANAQLKTGRYEDVIRTTQRTIAIAPQDRWAHTSKGQAEYELGRMEDAEKSFRIAVSLAQDPWARLALARTLRNLGRGEEAQAELERAKSQHPELATALDESFGKR